MLPTLIKIGLVPVHSYGLMIAVGFLAALHMVQREAKKHGIDPQIPNNLAFWGLFLMALMTALLCVTMIFRQPWTEKERLSFPISPGR